MLKFVIKMAVDNIIRKLTLLLFPKSSVGLRRKQRHLLELSRIFLYKQYVLILHPDTYHVQNSFSVDFVSTFVADVLVMIFY